MKAHVSHSNSISLHLNLENTTTVCYNAEAGNETKFVRVGGSYTFGKILHTNVAVYCHFIVILITIGPSAGKHTIVTSTSVSIIIILLIILVVIIVIMVAMIIVVYLVRRPKKSFASAEDNGRKSCFM